MSEKEVTPDHRRRERLGFDEAIFCEGKTPAQIAHIVDGALERGEPLLLTRLRGHKLDALAPAQRARIDYEPVSATGIVNAPPAPIGEASVAVVCAGTSDVGIAREAVRTLAYHGEPALEIYDVGVAGIWRLEARLEELRRAQQLIVVAGMDCAIASVLGGLLPQPIVVVPTSVGYGVAAGGQSALNAALASCAPGLVVVNIDNGYGAALASLRMRRLRAPLG